MPEGENSLLAITWIAFNSPNESDFTSQQYIQLFNYSSVILRVTIRQEFEISIIFLVSFLVAVMMTVLLHFKLDYLRYQLMRGTNINSSTNFVS